METNTPQTPVNVSLVCARKEEKKGLCSQAKRPEVIKVFCSSVHRRNALQIHPLHVMF